jgi:hypothetical protein
MLGFELDFWDYATFATAALAGLVGEAGGARLHIAVGAAMGPITIQTDFTATARGSQAEFLQAAATTATSVPKTGWAVGTACSIR